MGTKVLLTMAEAGGRVESEHSRRRQVFASAHQLVVEDSQNISPLDETLVNRTVTQSIVDQKGYVTQTKWRSMEVSRERLLELAEKARTRDEIEAEREPHRVLA